mgnify:CR=1 FL=1
MTTENRRILLTARPEGLVGPDCLTTVTEPVPTPAEGEALVRLAYLSIDPTNRVWMREEDSYLPAIPIGDVVRAAGLGVVAESRSDAYAVGDLVMGLLGWQDYAVVGSGDGAAQVIPPWLAPTDILSIYGSTGLTAWFGVHDVAGVREGDVFVVSGAAGGENASPVPASRAATNRSIGWPCSGPSGGAAAAGGMNAQCRSYVAPEAIQSRNVARSAADSVRPESGGGITSLGSVD